MESSKTQQRIKVKDTAREAGSIGFNAPVNGMLKIFSYGQLKGRNTDR